MKDSDKLIEKNVEIPTLTPTSEYSNKIQQIPTESEAIEIINNFKNYCSTGEHLIIPEGVTDIAGGVFVRSNDPGYSNHLMSVQFPSTLKTVGYQAFGYDNYLTEINIPHGCEYLYARAFYGCWNLEKISLPNTLISVYADTFTPTDKLTELIVESEFGCSPGNGIDFSSASFTAEIMVNIFNNLKDLSGQSAGGWKLGNTNLAKLTNEQKAIAINKNWNLF